jgi:hypothetical protein
MEKHGATPDRGGRVCTIAQTTPARLSRGRYVNGLATTRQSDKLPPGHWARSGRGMEPPSTASHGWGYTRRASHWSRRGRWEFAAIVPPRARPSPYVKGKLQNDYKPINHPEPIYKKQTCTALFEQWSSRFGTLEPPPIVYFKLRVSLSLRSSPMMTSETAFYQSILIYTLTCHQNSFISFILLTPSYN